MPVRDPRRPGRRLLLLGAGATLLAPLGGCGIRLEDDAPRLPLVPARTPLPGESLLASLTRDCDHLAALCRRSPARLAPALAVVHARQHTVLRTALVRAGAPGPLDDPTPSPGASATPAPATATALGAAEATAAAQSARFATVADALRVAVAALHAQRFAAATLLGSTPLVPGEPPEGDVAEEPAAAVDAAAYLLEVAAARSTGSRRRRATVTLAALRALHTDLAAGGTAPPPALGHPLPFPVRSGADVDRLVTETLTTLRETLGAALPALVDPGSADGVAAATRWLGAAEVEAHRWGLPLAPFPGLA